MKKTFKKYVESGLILTSKTHPKSTQNCPKSTHSDPKISPGNPKNCTFGPPNEAEQNQTAPFWAPKKNDRLPWRPLGHLLCPQTRSQEPLGTSQKSFKAKNANVKMSSVFPSKNEPWRTFANPGPSKRAPLGPDQLSREPPGRPLGRQTHLAGASRALPENPTGPNFETIQFFEKQKR